VPKLDELAAEGPEGVRAAALLTKADIAIQDGNLPAAQPRSNRLPMMAISPSPTASSLWFARPPSSSIGFPRRR
jgi:hypothetical protein